MRTPQANARARKLHPDKIWIDQQKSSQTLLSLGQYDIDEVEMFTHHTQGCFC